jgi:hypothetical protein
MWTGTTGCTTQGTGTVLESVLYMHHTLRVPNNTCLKIVSKYPINLQCKSLIKENSVPVHDMLKLISKAC